MTELTEGASPSETVLSTRRRRRLGAGLAALLTAAVILLLLRCGPEEPLPTGLAGVPAPSQLPSVSAPPPPAPLAGSPLVTPAGDGGDAAEEVSASLGLDVPASDASAPATGSAAPGHKPPSARVAIAERIEIGRVAAVRGAASAGPPGMALRLLDCGDPVFAGEHAYTASESRLGVLAGDVYIQLAPEAELALALTEAGALALGLERGQVRIVDAGSSGPAGRVSAMGAEAALLGNDIEARLYSDYAMLCARGKRLEVVRDGVQMDALPGECVVARSQAPLLTAQAPQEPIAFPQSAEEECRSGEVIGAASERFTPFDVAAVAILEPFLHPDLKRDLEPGPCDEPGATCSGQAAGQQPGGGDPPGEPPMGPKPPPNDRRLFMGPWQQPRGQIENPNSNAAPKFAAPNCCPRAKLPHQGPNKTARKAKK